MIKPVLKFGGLAISASTVILCFQCANVNFKSLNWTSETKTKPTAEKNFLSNEPRSLKTISFFEEQFSPGGYSYAYPNKSRVSYSDTISKNGLFSVQISLVANDYSGGAICRGYSADLTDYRSNAVLKFWIKGQRGAEIGSIGLVDESRSSREKAVVRLPINSYLTISSEWQLASIPLIDFPDRGVYWDASRKAEISCDIDWRKIAEVRIEIKKEENAEFTIFLDDLLIEPNVIDSSRYKPVLAWNRYTETVTPPAITNSPGEIVTSFFSGSLPKGSFTYSYGGKTACVPQKNGSAADRQILTCYLDNRDFSGVSVVTNSKNNKALKDLRKNNGGLAFWAKSKAGVKDILVGFLDNKKVQSRVSIAQYGDINEDWRLFTIPLRHFSDIGYYWDDINKTELQAPINWSTISEIRFSCGKVNNTGEEENPVTLYFDDIIIIKDISDSSENYWNSFQSSAPEMLLHDFHSIGKDNWMISKGPKSEISFELIDAPAKAPESVMKCMSVTYSLQDWCDVIYSYTKNKSDSIMRDWTMHWGIRFFLYTDKEFQGLTVQIADRGNELYVANIGALRGWNDIIIPFREFSKFIHFQPTETIQNNILDLNGIEGIDFKASGNGTSGVLVIGNIKLTNVRESKAVSLSK